MSTCNRCGSYVSESYAKVFGNNEDEVYACPSCERSRGMDTEASGGMVKT